MGGHNGRFNMKEIIKITRGEMIEHLVQSMLDDLEMNPDYLEVICRRGFMGYEEYTNKDLIQEYKEYISEESPEDVEIILEKEKA
jgi:hypothetical protein